MEIPKQFEGEAAAQMMLQADAACDVWCDQIPDLNLVIDEMDPDIAALLRNAFKSGYAKGAEEAFQFILDGGAPIS